MTTKRTDNPQCPSDLRDMVSVLFQQYAKPICAYIYSLTNDWDVAHDLMQETYLRLHQERTQLPVIENPRAWIYRIATNLTLNELKRRKRFAWLPWNQAQVAASLISSGMETTLHDNHMIHQTLAKLTPDYRVPLLLYSSYGLSVQEVATVLDLSESAVKVRLYRARERFRQLYEQEMQ